MKRFFQLYKNILDILDFWQQTHGNLQEWQHNGEPTGPYVHILGVRDRLFKSEKMANPIIIKDAGHFATFEKSDLICRLINCYVESEFDATETRLKSQLQWPSEMV
jgi:hypothetical protein